MTGVNTASSPMAVVEQICGSDTTNIVRGHREVMILLKEISDSTKMSHNTHSETRTT